MHRKRKFKPIIKRVKLNQEQAVLACSCYNTSNTYYLQYSAVGGMGYTNDAAGTIHYCMPNRKSNGWAIRAWQGPGNILVGKNEISSS